MSLKSKLLFDTHYWQKRIINDSSLKYITFVIFSHFLLLIFMIMKKKILISKVYSKSVPGHVIFSYVTLKKEIGSSEFLFLIQRNISWTL